MSKPYSRKPVAADDMHTLYREEHLPPGGKMPVGEGLSALMANIAAMLQRDFTAELQLWAKQLEQELEAAKWPVWNEIIQDLGNGSWCDNPCLSSQELFERVKQGESFILTRGFAFIEKNVKPLSDDYFRFRLRMLIDRIMRETNADHKLIAAYELGSIEETWRGRRAFRDGYEIGRKSIDGGKRGAANRVKRLAPELEARLARMAELIAAGHTKSRAAELTVRDFPGTTQDANRGLWYNYKR